MAGFVQDRGTFLGIARTLLALALLAERAAGRSLPVRFLVLAILGRAEKIARAFVARSMATLVAEAIEAGCPCPDIPCADLLAPDEPSVHHYGAAEAQLLALRLRILAALLGMLADEDGEPGERATCGSAVWVPVPGGGTARHADLILLLVFRRRGSCRSPPSCGRSAVPPSRTPS